MISGRLLKYNTKSNGPSQTPCCNPTPLPSVHSSRDSSRLVNKIFLAQSHVGSVRLGCILVK